jgi:hypothetical protein
MSKLSYVTYYFRRPETKTAGEDIGVILMQGIITTVGIFAVAVILGTALHFLG